MWIFGRTRGAKSMNNRLFTFLYGINIVSQAIFSLLMPTALTFGIAWLLVNRASAPSWIYAIFITVGVIAGLVSMVKFVISATANLENLEKQNRKGKDDDE